MCKIHQKNSLRTNYHKKQDILSTLRLVQKVELHHANHSLLLALLKSPLLQTVHTVPRRAQVYCTSAVGSYGTSPSKGSRLQASAIAIQQILGALFFFLVTFFKLKRENNNSKVWSISFKNHCFTFLCLLIYCFSNEGINILV